MSLKIDYIEKWVSDFLHKKSSIKINTKYRTFELEYLSDSTIQIVNTKGNRHGTLSIDTFKSIFLNFSGGEEINYRNTSGLYSYYKYAIKTLYGYYLKQIENSQNSQKNINKDSLLKEMLESKNNDELFSICKKRGIDLKQKMIEMLCS